MNTVIITKEEQKAIASLKRLAKKWPKTLSLFSWSGSLTVLKQVNGKDATIDSIDGIENDGGDPCCGEGIGDTVWYDSNVEIIYE